MEYLIPSCLYEKEPLQLCFTELRKKAVVFLCQNLIMRCFVTILAEIYGDPVFFGSGPGFVNRTQSDPGFVNPIRSSPGFVNPIRSDPVQVLLTPHADGYMQHVLYISCHFLTFIDTRLIVVPEYCSFTLLSL